MGKEAEHALNVDQFLSLDSVPGKGKVSMAWHLIMATQAMVTAYGELRRQSVDGSWR